MNYHFSKTQLIQICISGKSAGKKLLHEIENAQKSVKIISPFLSSIYIEKLINLKKSGIDIQLITSDELEDYKNPGQNRLIYELIKQVKYTDEIVQNKRNEWIKLN